MTGRPTNRERRPGLYRRLIGDLLREALSVVARADMTNIAKVVGVMIVAEVVPSAGVLRGCIRSKRNEAKVMCCTRIYKKFQKNWVESTENVTGDWLHVVAAVKSACTIDFGRVRSAACSTKDRLSPSPALYLRILPCDLDTTVLSYATPSSREFTEISRKRESEAIALDAVGRRPKSFYLQVSSHATPLSACLRGTRLTARGSQYAASPRYAT